MRRDQKQINERNMTYGRRLTIAAICLALCIVLPFLTGQIQLIANMISPMHIPVLICGFLAGPFYGAAVGFTAPLLRGALFGMPPLMPTGAAMAFELMTYGFAAGLLDRCVPKLPHRLYISLILSMLLGRIVWGIASYFLYSVSESAFTLEMFFTAAFVKAIPAIIIHIALIPPIVRILRKAAL